MVDSAITMACATIQEIPLHGHTGCVNVKVYDAALQESAGDKDKAPLYILVRAWSIVKGSKCLPHHACFARLACLVLYSVEFRLVLTWKLTLRIYKINKYFPVKYLDSTCLHECACT